MSFALELACRVRYFGIEEGRGSGVELYYRIMIGRGGRAKALGILDKCQEEDCYSCEPSPSPLAIEVALVCM